MKTTTILNAYIKARDRRFGIHAGSDRFRQCNTFHAALLRRIYDGDRAREALEELKFMNWRRSAIKEEFEP